MTPKPKSTDRCVCGHPFHTGLCAVRQMLTFQGEDTPLGTCLCPRFRKAKKGKRK